MRTTMTTSCMILVVITLTTPATRPAPTLLTTLWPAPSSPQHTTTPLFLTTSLCTPISSSTPHHCLQPTTIHSFLHPTCNALMQCSSPAFKMSQPLQQPQNSQKKQWRWRWRRAQYVSRLVYHTSVRMPHVLGLEWPSASWFLCSRPSPPNPPLTCALVIL